MHWEFYGSSHTEIPASAFLEMHDEMKNKYKFMHSELRRDENWEMLHFMKWLPYYTTKNDVIRFAKRKKLIYSCGFQIYIACLEGSKENIAFR
jgi:hypothetical protein